MLYFQKYSHRRTDRKMSGTLYPSDFENFFFWTIQQGKMLFKRGLVPEWIWANTLRLPAFHIQDAGISVPPPRSFLEATVRPWIFHYNTIEKYFAAITKRVSTWLNACFDRSHFAFENTWQIHHDLITIAIKNGSLVIIVLFFCTSLLSALKCLYLCLRVYDETATNG